MTHGANAPTLRQQVYLQLRAAIEQGSLAPGARLPPSREQAQALGVARNTVLWALERLRAEGYVEARVGDGSYVAQNHGALRAGVPRASVLASGSGLSRRGQLMADTAVRWKPYAGPTIAFRAGQPDAASFPTAVWDRLTRQLAAEQRRAAAQYLDPAGSQALREAIAHWLAVSRGVRCDARQIIVTSGSQQAIDLIARLLLDADDEVIVEDPGYLGIRANLLSHGAQVRPVEIDDEGLRIAQGAARWPRARMAVVTPTHQYPMGVRMSLTRRQALIEWARKTQAWIVEDDYDGEFQYGTQRVPALHSLPHGDRVLYVGTFSKTLHPGLRLGFIVLPAALAPAFASARALSDRHGPGEVQEVLARFIADGHLIRHLRRMRELYQQRQAVVIETLAKYSGGALRLAPSEQGLHLMVEAMPPRPDVPLSAQAREAGVFLAPLSAYTIESARRGWLIGYAGFETADLRAAARTLAPLMRRALD